MPKFVIRDEIIPPVRYYIIRIAYTSRAAAIEAGEISGFSAFVATLVDGMGIANALVIRGQALLLPIRVLVFS